MSFQILRIALKSLFFHHLKSQQFNTTSQTPLDLINQYVRSKLDPRQTLCHLQQLSGLPKVEILRHE